MKKQNTKQVEEMAGNEMQCVGVHELIDFQIIQYRQAVDEHRLDLSKAEGRCISWQEAEHDFTSQDRTVMSEKARVEYCGLVCPHSTNCLTALHFLNKKKTETLYHRVG